jgi:hypothetical protein
MIGETAYETKAGGRCLGTIVGQRTVGDAEGRPVEQWEIRSGRGIRFFMDKAGVRVGTPPPAAPPPGAPPLGTPTPSGPTPGGPTPGTAPDGTPPPAAPTLAPPGEVKGAVEPGPPPVVPVMEASTRLEVRSVIAEELRQRRSIVPAVVTSLGVVLFVVCVLLFALGLQDRAGDAAGVPLAFAPGLLGLLVILIDDQARRLQKRRIELLKRARERAAAEARERTLERTAARTSTETPEGASEETQ